jgi:hypothetical protein
MTVKKQETSFEAIIERMRPEVVNKRHTSLTAGKGKIRRS